MSLLKTLLGFVDVKLQLTHLDLLWIFRIQFVVRH